MRSLLSILAIATLLFADHVCAQDVKIRLLERLVRLTEQDKNQLDNLFNGRSDPTFRQTSDYSSYLTSALIDSIRSEETRLLNQTCQGHYRDGEICGLDYSPITCAQDTPTFTYKVIKLKADKAIITAQHLSYPDIATYYLIRVKDHWKVDGIDCLGITRFNVPTH